MSVGKILFEGAVPITTTKYIGVPIREGVCGFAVGWKDATSAATVTLEFTDLNADRAPTETAGEAWEWGDSGETIAGPAGSAAGKTQVHLENVRAARARIKIVTTAACDFLITDGNA